MMKMEPSGSSIQVAIKLAFTKAEKATLEREHQLYSHLHSKGVRGIPRDFGLFVDEELLDGMEGPYALIMTYAGVSLSAREKRASDPVKLVIYLGSIYLSILIVLTELPFLRS
jgi:hypothetical protein